MSNYIPAGILDRNIEFFSIEGEVFCIQNRQIIPFEQCDVLTINLVREALDADSKAQKALDNMGIIDPIKQLKQFLLCRFGDFDHRADITDDGIITSEYVICPLRGTCKSEGKLCLAMKAANGYLTPKEIEVIQLIGEDLSDKEIAYRLGISQNTVNVHRSNIEKKIGCNSKVGIAVFAAQHHII